MRKEGKIKITFHVREDYRVPLAKEFGVISDNSNNVASNPKQSSSKITISRKWLEIQSSDSEQAETSKRRKKNDDVESPVRVGAKVMQRCLIQRFLLQKWCRVHYRSRKFGGNNNGADVGHYVQLARGNISRWGIKCDCCSKMFSVSAFEKHAAGSTKHDGQASRFIYVEEYGRSLMSYLMPFVKNSNAAATDPRVKFFNDDICSVCHCDRDQDDNHERVIMCDRCQSVFHPSCVPFADGHGHWICPSCCCGVCGHGDFQEENEVVSAVNHDEHVHGRLVVCQQCETNYHAGCLSNSGIVFSDSGVTNGYFCSRGCENIYLGLRKILLGKPIPVDTPEGDNNLTWTMLKYRKSGLSNILDLIKNTKQLQMGMKVMHECFDHAVTYNQRDVVEDVIMNHMSDSRPLNFVGFYTVVLKRGSEVVTVANVRIYGQKVAEIPLIATRSQYRRLGMCKILMNALEKQLSVLEVERLIMHATPSALHTCINSLGFSKMAPSERLSLIKYALLDFPDTIMCHKLLSKSSSSPSSKIKIGPFSSPSSKIKIVPFCTKVESDQAEVEEKQ